MSSLEDNTIRSEEVPVEEPAQDIDSNDFSPTKIYAVSAAALAFIARAESMAGLEAGSTATLKLAGAVAVGAAVSGVAGLVMGHRKH